MTGPLDRLLDVVLYAPLGLALKAAEELPKLAAHGREKVGSQSDLARAVGKMAVAQGRRKVDDMLERRAGPAAGSPPTTTTPAADFVAGPTGAAVPVPAPEPSPGVAAPADVAPAPDADALPIPGYDSLSASQVVQRLAGLSSEELEAVRTYEQAGRGRKTVLLRVAQLRATN